MAPIAVDPTSALANKILWVAGGKFPRRQTEPKSFATPGLIGDSEGIRIKSSSRSRSSRFQQDTLVRRWMYCFMELGVTHRCSITDVECFLAKGCFLPISASTSPFPSPSSGLTNNENEVSETFPQDSVYDTITTRAGCCCDRKDV